MKYVHGYDQKENIRLKDQASTLSELLHHDTVYPAHDRILEPGCGVGAQTISLARNNPNSQFISIDISTRSIAEAKNKIEVEGLKNVTFQQGDIFRIEDRTLVRIFPIYNQGDTNQYPTGRTRKLVYGLYPGEVMWQLKVEKSETLNSP